MAEDVDPQRVLEVLLPAVGAPSTMMTNCEILEVRLDEDCEVTDEELWVDVRFLSAYDGAEQSTHFNAHPNEWGWGSLQAMMLLQVDEDDNDRVWETLGGKSGCPDPQSLS